MNTPRLKRHPQSIRALYCVSLPAMLLIMSASLRGQTTDIQPGQSVTLDTYSDSSCGQQTSGVVNWINGAGNTRSVVTPRVACTVLKSNRIIKLQAGDGLLFAFDTRTQRDDPTLAEGELPLRHGSATGSLINTIRIPAAGAGEAASEVLTAQISTEIEWDGLLWIRSFIIPAWSQVIGTLRVRDLTTGLVVASETFLHERVQLDKLLPDLEFIDNVSWFYGWNSVRSSTGVDIQAQLIRGREYAVEVEGKCENLSTFFVGGLPLFPGAPGSSPRGVWSGGGCFFGRKPIVFVLGFTKQDYNPGVGFQVSPLTVTVQDDLKAKLAEALKTLDSDGDGIIDPEDACPQSDLSPTVVIDSCDSGVENTLFENGCTVSDEIAKCAASAGNHGQFTSCVAGLTNDKDNLLADGSGLWRQRGPIQSCAAQASIL